MRNITNQAIN